MKYVLDGKTPVKCDDLYTWGEWMETANRHVAKEVIGDAQVSTVFLGMDHAWGGAEPLLFETMIFGGPHDGYQDRCSTWAEAEAMHAKAVALVKGESPETERTFRVKYMVKAQREITIKAESEEHALQLLEDGKVSGERDTGYVEIDPDDEPEVVEIQ